MSDHAGPDDPADPAGVGPVGGDLEDAYVDGDRSEDTEPRRYPSTIGGAFYLVVLVTALTSLGIIAGGDWRVGLRVLAAGLGAAGLMRLLLPQRDAGMLAVRHRLFDVAMLVVVAGVLWWLAGSIPDQPST